VTQEDSVYTIADRGSTNGTFRNEKRVSTPQVLKEGDRIRVGQVILAFRRLPAAVEAQASAAYESPPTVMAPIPPASAAAPSSAPPQAQSTPGSGATNSPIRWLVVGILAALLLCMLAGAGLFYALGGSDLDLPVLWRQATSTPEPIVVTESPVIPAVTVVVTNSPEPIVTVVVTNTPEPTLEATPTATPTVTPLPTATLPPTATPTPGPMTVQVAADGSGDFAGLAEAVAAVSPGSTIQLAAGTYPLSASLEISKSLTLTGAGMDATEIRGTAGESVIDFAGPGQRITLQDVTVRYAGTDWSNVLVVHDAEIDMAGCRLTGGIWSDEEEQGGSGLLVRGDSTGHVRESWFEGNGLHGIEIQDRSQLTVEGNVMRNNAQSGIIFWESSGGTALQNRCTGNGLNGISLQDQAQATLESNTCTDNEQAGIRYAGESGGSARRNTCSSNGLHGISLHDQAQPTLEGNTCSGNGEAGIVYFENSGGVARSNLCENNKWGLYLAETSNPILEGNEYRNNAKADVEDRR
ncbi:MAG: right-handed parallel beta-helix repeat-containing protein, partial [Anaerolineae bacterium]